jgi:hypothetical protein
MQRKKNAVLSRDFESKVVGSKRAPAMNPWRQNPDRFSAQNHSFLAASTALEHKDSPQENQTILKRLASTNAKFSSQLRKAKQQN